MTQNTEVDSKRHIKKAFTGGFKGLLSSIPIIGSTVVDAWEGYWASRGQDTIDQLTHAIVKLGQEKIDKEFVRGEEFIDLFQKSLRTVMQSRSKKKAKFILGLLTETVRKERTPEFSTSLKESFLSLLDQLSDEEIEFLYDFSLGLYAKKTKTQIYQLGDNRKGIAIDGLLAKGLLREDDT